MGSPLDRFAPCSRFALPDGSILTIGTVTQEDHITKDVLISHEDPSVPEPVLQLSLPPRSVDLVIKALQDRANEARFVNGEAMLDYPAPVLYSPKPKPKSKGKARK